MSLPPHHGNQTLQLKIPWFPAGHVDWWVLMLFFAKCHSSRPRCLMYEVLVGHQPFWGSQEEIRQKVLAADVRYPPGLSEAAVHLMFCHWVLDSRWRRWAGSRWYIYIYIQAMVTMVGTLVFIRPKGQNGLNKFNMHQNGVKMVDHWG